MNLPSDRQYGLIAQELEAVFPELVTDAVEPEADRDSTATGGEDDTVSSAFKCVNYVALIPVLVRAVQEQQAIIEQQQVELERLSELIAE